MDEGENISHKKWRCKYHVVFIPKCRRKTQYSQLRHHLWEVIRKLAKQKESRIEEVRLMPDRVHIIIPMPPKYVVSQVVGYIRGKCVIHLARVYRERKRNFVRQHFWAWGYFVSTVGRYRDVIRAYIRYQEREGERLEQMKLLRRRATCWWPERVGAALTTANSRFEELTFRKPPALPGNGYCG